MTTEEKMVALQEARKQGQDDVLKPMLAEAMARPSGDETRRVLLAIVQLVTKTGAPS